MKKFIVIFAVLLSLLFVVMCHAEVVTQSGNIAPDDIKLIDSILLRTADHDLTVVDGTYEVKGVQGELAIITYTINCKAKDGSKAWAKIRVTLENPDPDPLRNTKVLEVRRVKPEVKAVPQPVSQQPVE